MSELHAPCHSCGETEWDLQVCAGCNHHYCPECIDWCAPEYDPPNGDYFCSDCQIEERPIMTIHVHITNTDSREAAIIRVQATKPGTTEKISGGHDKILKGGESCEVTIHDMQNLTISEVLNG